MLQTLWAKKASWLPGIVLVILVLFGLSFLAGGPSVVFKYIF